MVRAAEPAPAAMVMDTQARMGLSSGTTQASFSNNSGYNNSGLLVANVSEAVRAGFIEETFYPGETPLGLVIDWSMALPVVSSFLPRSPASKRPALRFGLVLVAVNRQEVPVGFKREEIVGLLEARPLTLAFEAPDFIRIGPVGCAAWRQRCAPQQTMPANEITFSNSMTPKDMTGQSFFEMHPERIHLSRYGDLECTSQLPMLQRSLPQIVLAPKHQQSPGRPLTKTWSDGFGGSTSLAQRTDGFGSIGRGTGDSWQMNQASGMLGRAKSIPSLSLRGANDSKGSMPWLKAAAAATNGEVRNDPCYTELLLADPRPRGPGPPMRWPLGHLVGRSCTLKDIVLASCMIDAYEVGFRAEKFRPPTEMELKFPEMAISPRPKTIQPVEEMRPSCDVCGIELTEAPPDEDANEEGQQPVPSPVMPLQPKRSEHFYFCRRCKHNGSRFELCLGCHATTVLQAEGKHTGMAPHPHYLRCEHAGLLRRRDMRDAYPGTAHFNRAYCDHCGKRIGGYNPTAGKIGAIERDDAIYVCPRCPEVHGVRFEMCGSCAHVLLDRGAAVRRLGGMVF